MDTGSLIALSLALIFAFLVLPWIFALAYRWRRTSRGPREPRKIVDSANGYRRYYRYTFLVLAWALIITAYLAVLDHAVNDPDFMGPHGSPDRTFRFDVLSFIRTGFAVVHLPLLTAVLAATVPYWTMAKSLRPGLDDVPMDPTNGIVQRPQHPTRVSQIFYLSDRTWSGLLGWGNAAIYGVKEGGFSLYWVQLAIIAGLAYIGFPLLSLAYTTTSTQYWEPLATPSTASLGGLNMSTDDFLRDMSDPQAWTYYSPILNTTLAPLLTTFNSSSLPGPAFIGITNQTRYFPWADNQTMISRSPGLHSNVQLPLVGVRASTTCGMGTFNNFTDLVPGTSQGAPFDINLDLATPVQQKDGNWTLSCRNNCSTDTDGPSCSSRAAQTNLTSFTYLATYQYDEKLHADVGTFRFANVSDTVLGETLSCTHQDNTDTQSVSRVFLAAKGANSTIQAASCNISITYFRPTVNTLIGSYIESTGSSSDIPVLAANPAILMNLTLSPFINFFHAGGPKFHQSFSLTENCTVWPTFSGFSWVSAYEDDMVPSNACYIYLAPETPAQILREEPGPGGPIATSFDETVFLGPLANILSNPSFFQNGTVNGVVFKTNAALSYGSVPPILAIIVLAIPILWTIALSIISNTQRRWTPTFDAFSIFKLGGDWTDELKDLRLASLSKASEVVKQMPGTVVVNPEAGEVRLAQPPPRLKLPKELRKRGLIDLSKH